ncbi:MAG TPA: acetyl-CoA C-acyltransferase [candidate division Zixibacteria bacterium]|nr:acetyl-CoA C-acyltransferase [candidate division Zixibacteria bacterium]
MKDAVIIAAKRTAVGKGFTGSLVHVHPVQLGAVPVKAVVSQISGLDAKLIDELILGCAMPEGEQGLNVARLVGLAAGLPDGVPAMTVNRFCASGLEVISLAANRIRLGEANCIIAAGVESMSAVPMGGNKVAPELDLVRARPESYISMGLTAENLAEKYKVSREEQDKFALESHRKAIAAIDNGIFGDQIAPVEIALQKLNEKNKAETAKMNFSTDEGPRRDTSMEALGKLQPAFKKDGTVTAGNSSQISDAAAGVIIAEAEFANKQGWKPLARFVGYATAGVAPEIMGIGPVEAVPKLLKRTGLSLSDLDVILLNEAFAVQGLAVIRDLGLDANKVNPNGGAIALGHPLGATGTKLTVELMHELERSKKKYGMVMMCVGGGMGAAGIFERIS